MRTSAKFFLLSMAVAAALFFGASGLVSAEPVKYDKETQVELKDKTKFKISSGWSFDEAKQRIQSPEGDLNIYLIEKPFNNNAEELSETAWKTINDKFDFKVLQKPSPPPQYGWEQNHNIIYDVPARENRSVFSIIHVFKGNAYLMLVDGANSAMDKRGAQFQIIVDTWRPDNLHQEDLSQKQAKKFSKADAIQMDKFISDAMIKLSIPGVAIAIIQHDQVVYRKAFGIKLVGSSDKVTPETMFMIGSTTKPLTTLMLAKLVEQGRLKWTTPVKTALPSFELADKNITDKFLIKHTVCACTGMPRRDMEEVFGSKIVTIYDTLKQLHSMKPTSGFGETFQYSNQLVAVGGLAGANVYDTGIDLFNKYENAMSDLVFSPLKMTSTRVRPRDPDLERLASPHASDYDGKMVPFPQKIDDMAYAIAPAGSIWSDVDDIAKYVQMELRNGKDENGKQLYSEEQIMKRRRAGVKVDENTTYGLGLFIENDKGAHIISHDGNTLGFTSQMLFLPKYDLGLVVLSNAGSANGFRNAMKQKLLEIFLGADEKSAELVHFAVKNFKETNAKLQERVSLKAPDLTWIKEYVGHYDCKELGSADISESTDGHFKFSTARWSSEIGSAKEASGEKLLALTSAPWWLGEIRVQQSPQKKLILDDPQIKYEFIQTSVPANALQSKKN